MPQMLAYAFHDLRLRRKYLRGELRTKACGAKKRPDTDYGLAQHTRGSNRLKFDHQTQPIFTHRAVTQTPPVSIRHKCIAALP